MKNPGDVHNRDTSPLASPSKDVDGFVKAIHDDDFFKFCFVRNPFTRTLSCYLDKMVNTEYERIRLAPKLGISTTHIPTFREFLEIIAEQTDEQRDIHWASQTYLLRPNRVKYSFIGRFEIFRDHFKLVCEHLQISEYASDLSSSWHATNAYEKIKDYMGDTEIDLICRIYESDFRNFGYGWSPVVC